MAKAKKKAPAKKKTAAKKKPRKATATAAAPTEVLLVGSKVKAAIRAAGCNTGGDATDALNGYVHWLIGQATARAQHNGRKTVRAHDFCIM